MHVNNRTDVRVYGGLCLVRSLFENWSGWAKQIDNPTVFLVLFRSESTSCGTLFFKPHVMFLTRIVPFESTMTMKTLPRGLFRDFARSTSCMAMTHWQSRFNFVSTSVFFASRWSRQHNPDVIQVGGAVSDD